MPPLYDTSDVDSEFLVEGEALVTRHVFSAQVKEDDIEQQRENIFHTCCHVNNKEIEDVFPKDGPSGFLPKETKKLQCKVEGFISPCVVHVLLVPKKDGSWRMYIYFRAINNIMVEIQGRIFSRKRGMMRIKE